MARMFISSGSVEQELISEADRDRWPFTMSCVPAIARDGLELNCPVTFQVGENGSGISTLLRRSRPFPALVAQTPRRDAKEPVAVADRRR